jgi:rare lipoprotein A
MTHPSPRGTGRVLARRILWIVWPMAVLFAAGCGSHRALVEAPPPQEEMPALSAQQAQEYDPPPPQRQEPRSWPAQREASDSAFPAAAYSSRIPVTPVPPGGVTEADLQFVSAHRPVLTEVGMATWYTAPYKGRKAANGQTFDDLALTAAHRTLPMGSLVSVTNLSTGQSAVMRITDRGPFVDGRIVDLTVASAKATGVYRSGLARVRIDVYKTPKPIDAGGRWCVQVGAFTDPAKAARLKEILLRKFPRANVIQFSSVEGAWVRIRPEGDDREEAEYIVRHLMPPEGEAFLTRLD